MLTLDDIMSKRQRESYLYGAEMGAEYLKEIGKTDLKTLTPEEVLIFSECVCKNYHLNFISCNYDD